MRTHLEVFNVVATHRSFTKAAEVLCISQPTVSDHIGKLEKRFNVKLFLRCRPKLKLTELGKELLTITNQQFALQNKAEDILRYSKVSISEHLRIGVPHTSLILPIIQKLKACYPYIKISLAVQTESNIRKLLHNDAIDVAIISQDVDDTLFVAVPCIESEVVAFINNYHPWKKRKYVRISEIESECLIYFENGNYRNISEFISSQNLNDNNILKLSNLYDVYQAVKSNLGIAISYKHDFASEDSLKIVRLLNNNTRIRYNFVFNKCKKGDKKILITLNLLEELNSIQQI